MDVDIKITFDDSELLMSGNNAYTVVKDMLDDAVAPYLGHHGFDNISIEIRSEEFNEYMNGKKN